MKELEYSTITKRLSFTNSSEIEDYIDNTVNYSGITTTFVKDCGTEITISQTVAETADTDSVFYVDTVNRNLQLKCTAFGLTAFVDGVFFVKIRLKKTDSSYIEISNCIFLDLTYKCKVAENLDKLLVEEQNNAINRKMEMIYAIHFGLTAGSNCGCNCADLCIAFTRLKELLGENILTLPDCE